MKHTIKNTVTITILAMMLILTTGCSTLETAMGDSIKYGKLIALQDALEDAVNNCDNEKAMWRAKYWAQIGIVDIREQGGYFKKGTPEYFKAINAVNNLALISRTKTLNSCNEMESVYKVTNDFIIHITSRT
jgi:hypothetical protein